MMLLSRRNDIRLSWGSMIVSSSSYTLPSLLLGRGRLLALAGRIGIGISVVILVLTRCLSHVLPALRNVSVVVSC